MTLRAVVFDVGGVLERVDDANWPARWLDRWAERAGVPMSDVQDHMARYESRDGIATGLVTEAQMRELYATALRLDAAEAVGMMTEMWDLYCGTLDEEMYRFCASLRPGYRTAILSNSADGARREEQRRYGFEQLVDVLVYSHEVGVAKPDPAIYDLTAQRLGLPPRDIVLIDDVPANVEAAKRCGWSAVLHVEAGSSIARVQELLG